MLAENLQKFIVSLLYGSLVLQSFIVLVNPMNAGEAFKNVIYLLQIFTPILLYFKNKLYYTVAMFIDVSHNLLYLIILYFKIKHHQSRIQIISSNTDHVNLQWLVKFIHLWMDMLFLGMVYMTSYYSLRQKEIYPIDEHQRKELLAFELEDPAELDKKKLISDEEFEITRQRLLLVMVTEKPYLDGELNLIRLAQLMQMRYNVQKSFY
eukprot:gene17388-20826_t